MTIAIEEGHGINLSQTIGAEFDEVLMKRIGADWKEKKKYREFLDISKELCTENGEFQDRILDVFQPEDRRGLGILFKDGSLLTVCTEENKEEIVQNAMQAFEHKRIMEVLMEALSPGFHQMMEDMGEAIQKKQPEE